MNSNDIIPGFDEGKPNGIEIRLRTVDAIDNCIVLNLVGHLDTYNTGYYQNCVSKTIQAGYIRLIFDCHGLEYVCSSFDLWMGTLKILKALKGDLVVQNMQPKLYQIFQLLRVDELLTFTKNLDESIAYLAKHVESPSFPKVVTCPICTKPLKASKAGQFRCSQCNTIISIHESTSIGLG